jgi:hypothetical protein
MSSELHCVSPQIPEDRGPTPTLRWWQNDRRYSTGANTQELLFRCRMVDYDVAPYLASRRT